MSKGQRFEILDPELCFKLLKKFGSLEKVAHELSEAGVINPITGKPPTRQGVHLALKRAKGYAKYVKDRNSVFENSKAALRSMADNV